MLLEARGADRPPLRYPLDPARHAVIGRGEDADIRVDHDPHVSRRHAEVWIEEGVLNVAVLPGAGDPVFQHGAEITRGSVEPGDHFVIGRTRFILLADRPATVMDETRLPTLRETLPTEGDLAAGQGADRLRLLDLLELPEILASRSPPEYFLHLSGLLRMATGAQEACVINEAGTILARDAVVPAGRRPSAAR